VLKLACSERIRVPEAEEAKEAISEHTHGGAWGFCVSSRVANESCHEETLDKMLIALISASPCEFSVWFLNRLPFSA